MQQNGLSDREVFDQIKLALQTRRREFIRSLCGAVRRLL